MISQTDYSTSVQGYIDGVLSGVVTAGRLVRLAVRRHVTDLAASVADDYPYVFRAMYANEAIAFVEMCPQSKGKWAGCPLRLQPWQQFVVWCVFGWRRRENLTRRFRKAFVSVARKNGKSTLAAAIGLLLTMFDDPLEGGAEVYVVATKEDQARIIHEEAKRMVRRSPDLSRAAKVLTKAITVARNDGTFRPLGSDSDQSGFNPHGVIKDELHAWRDRHRNLHDEMSTGGASRAQPLEIIITTAGDDTSNIWMEELDYATRVVESVDSGQVVSDFVFAFIACLDSDDDPYDVCVWAKANPNLNVSVSEQYLREQAAEARAKPPAHNAFLRYHCNLKTTSHERAILPELWHACRVDAVEHGDMAFGAIDLGRADDWAAVAIVSQQGDEVRVWAKSYTCQERSRELETAEVSEWIAGGWLVEHVGNAVDFDAIEADVAALSRGDARIINWAIDPMFASQFGQRLINVWGLEVYEFIQTSRSYNEPIRRFLRALKSNQVRHGINPCLDWQARNMTIRRDNRDLWMPDKGTGWQKIDAMAAVIMAYAGIVHHEHVGTPAIY